jgi:hypothetical protein
VTNDLAYYNTKLITAMKRFKIQAPGANLIELFSFVIFGGVKYARAFVSLKFFQVRLTYARKAGANPTLQRATLVLSSWY